MVQVSPAFSSVNNSLNEPAVELPRLPEQPLSQMIWTEPMSSVVSASLDGSWTVNERVRLDGGIARYAETRDRPDAATFDWNQWRLHAGVHWLFGSGADRGGMPPAVLAIPEREPRP